jgi:hypothetical protein
MTKEEELIQTIKVLRQEVEVLTTRLEPAGTGYLITTIDTLNSRIDELMLKAIAPMLDDVEHTEEYYDKNRNRPVESLL